MSKNLKFILSTFTNQRVVNDCGSACLMSVCKYAGLTINETGNSDLPVSLLQLRKIATDAGLKASCVKMDEAALKSNLTPCILHTQSNGQNLHFVVHYFYDSKNGMHLIGDPASRVLWMSTEKLLV